MSQNSFDIKILTDQLEGTQATFSVWLVAVGDQVKEGQPIAELETDKVAMEVCAITDGTIESLLAKVGDKIEPEQVLGKIVKSQLVSSEKTLVGAQINSKLETNKHQIEKTHEANLNSDQENSDQLSELNASGRELVSPAVRRLLLENNLNINDIQGNGKRGRVTRSDVLMAIKSGSTSIQQEQASQLLSRQHSRKHGRQHSPLQTEIISPTEMPVIKEAQSPTTPFDQVVPVARTPQSSMIPHSNMRKSIASHMVSSLLETSPHVTSVFEMDMTNIIEHRKWHKKEYLECGVKLTFTAYFLSAMAQAVAKVPQVNAKFHEDALEIFSDVNIGVGTALGGSGLEDSGLVVPVVQQVQAMNLFSIAKSLNSQTEKARTNKLKPSDMKNGTLTISNHGVSGSLFATPIIINQPQVAILGVGKLEKRVVVEQLNGVDTMVIRPKCYVSLSIDHRALDALQTNLYLSEFVSIIENWGMSISE